MTGTKLGRRASVALVLVAAAWGATGCGSSGEGTAATTAPKSGTDGTSANPAGDHGGDDDDAAVGNDADGPDTTGVVPVEQEVPVAMGDMWFRSAVTAFKAGATYRFVLTNEGTVPHEFTIAPPREPGQDEADLDELSLIDVDELAPGETRTVDVTFPVAGAGSLEFECSYPGHYEGGMHLPITVQ